MMPLKIPPRKLFKLTNATVKKADEVTPADLLIGEDGMPKKGIGWALQTSKVYEVLQYPYGENYTLGENEKLALMLLIPPKVMGLRVSVGNVSLNERRGSVATEGEQEYMIEGCERSLGVVKMKASNKELAMRLSRNFLQPGDKIEILVSEYIKKSEGWKSLFGGYYLPTGVSGAKRSPFSPLDMAYLIPKSKSCLSLGFEERRKALGSFIDLFGTSNDPRSGRLGGVSPDGDAGVLFSASPDVLKTIRELSKSIGYLPSVSPEGKLFIVFNRRLDTPLAYPIELKYLGEYEAVITPGNEKVLLEDGTVSFW
jgi:hypothetical protein